MAQPPLRRFRLLSTEDTTREVEDGAPVVIPAGSVVNEVLWDGVSEWTPPAGTRAEPLPDQD